VSAFDIRACADLIDPLTEIAIAAAAAIRNAQSNSGVRIKADGSPVTAADDAAEALIRDRLAQLVPVLPIISEEQAARELPVVTAKSYFLVDPLDGTREFIAGREEYSVNIAIGADGKPILGIIAAPALDQIWRGIAGRGAERLDFSSGKASAPQQIHTRARPENELVVLVSRSHLDARTEAYIAGLPRARRVACGSSLKFCRVAEGAADHYPRLGPTRDWDVAAGHAVLAAAGGKTIDPDGTALCYGSTGLRIPAFLAWGDARKGRN
jgi:3'(2'), 5'-bisphosphate nucleotidase